LRHRRSGTERKKSAINQDRAHLCDLLALRPHDRPACSSGACRFKAQVCRQQNDAFSVAESVPPSRTHHFVAQVTSVAGRKGYSDAEMRVVSDYMSRFDSR
jgi:hypothetical protein